MYVGRGGTRRRTRTFQIYRGPRIAPYMNCALSPELGTTVRATVGALARENATRSLARSFIPPRSSIHVTLAAANANGRASSVSQRAQTSMDVRLCLSVAFSYITLIPLKIPRTYVCFHIEVLVLSTRFALMLARKEKIVGGKSSRTYASIVTLCAILLPRYLYGYVIFVDNR